MSWPSNVGIKAIEVYFPAQYVDQSDLEIFDKVSPGKYTVGLGQSKMGFCNDREDINSLCLTVVSRLMDRYDIKPEEIGRLEVGTETVIDKSKSVKSVLMQLFEPSGCTDIEGVDSTNACYGGTAALFNAVAWVESSSYDGRFALVVAGDNAVYASGSARPTGGAGAIAMLIGPNAPIVFDRGVRASYMRHVYDFYKPNLNSEYPMVDGKLSIQCYLSALDNCYKTYRQKSEKKNSGESISLSSFGAVLFHSPYGKLVQKSFARLAFNDYLNSSKSINSEKYLGLEKFAELKLEDTYFDRDVEKAFITLSNNDFIQKAQPSLLISNLVGNMYTPSVYSGLVSYLISKPIEQLAGTKVGIFSYGSGLASSMYSLTIANDSSVKSDLERIVSRLSYVKPQLESRRRATPEEFTQVLEIREKNCHKAPYRPISNVDDMFDGTYYLETIDDQYRRTYGKVSKSK